MRPKPSTDIYVGKPNMRGLAAVIVGNTLEWYDFIIYGFLAVFIARQFFPPGDDTAALLATFATFALSFVVRPIGGVLIGLYADRYGRKPAMTFVMGSMTVAMLIMVVVPSYASIGVSATILMVVARLLQALSAGGEFASAASYLLESVPKSKRGFYSGLYSSGPQIATVLAALMGLTISWGMSEQSRNDWGWRLPFAIGLLIAPVGYYIRRYLPESEAFAQSVDRRGWLERLRVLFKDHLSAIAVAIAVVSVVNASAYVLVVYAPTFVVRTLHLPPYMPFIALLVSGGTGMFFNPLLGSLGDRIGANRLLFASLVITIVTVIPLYMWISTNPSLAKLLVSAAVISLLSAVCGSVYPTIMAYLFPADVRSTAMAISFNLSATIFGGSSLYFITVLIDKTGSSLMPAVYVAGLACVSLLVVTIFRGRLASPKE